MTVGNDNLRNDYTGNGVASTFAYDFPILSSADLKVIKRLIASPYTATTLTLNTNYTVTGVGEEDGSITLTAGALSSAYTLHILINPDVTQEASFTSQGSSNATTWEDAFDSVLNVCKLVWRIALAAIRIPEYEDPDDYPMTLPGAETRANKIVGFDEDGQLEMKSSGDAADLATSFAAVNTYTNSTVTALNTSVQASLLLKADKTTTLTPSAPLTGGGSLASNMVLGITNATETNTGVVVLAANGGTGANTVVQGNDTRLVGGNGRFYYGDGADGALSLGSNTTLASGDNIKRYTNLTLNGFTLKNNSADNFLIIYVSGTLSLGGGKIITDCGATAGGVAATAGGGGTAGTGGAGGAIAGALFVYAKTITGTGTIKSSNDGADGTNAVNYNTGGVAKPGGTGATATNAGIIYGQAANYPANPGPGTSYVGGVGSATYTATNVLRNYLLLQNWLYITGDVSLTVANPWKCKSIGGSGGAGGSLENGATFGGGGGGGGGPGYGASGAGGNGSHGVYSGLPSGDSAASGGGGGGGGGGGVVVVITNTAPSTLTVSANGGNGGAGKLGMNTLDLSICGNGGGGGGGGGGLAILVAQESNGATVTASAGAGGTVATPVNGSVAGAAGSAGGAGIAMNLTI